MLERSTTCSARVRRYISPSSNTPTHTIMKRSLLIHVALCVVSSIIGAIVAVSFIEVKSPDATNNGGTTTDVCATQGGEVDDIPNLSDAVEHVSEAVVYIGEEAGSHGSGVVISEDGYIVTNYHVIEDSKELYVRYTDGNIADAEVVGYDEEFDIALLKVDTQGKSLAYAKFGTSDHLRQGEWVVAIGYPFSLDLTMTIGIVSAKIRSNSGYQPFIQVDALINPGNSGGALINSRGELVGINTEMASGLYDPEKRANYGYGFAIPSELVKRVVTDLRDYGYVLRPSLGIKEKSVTSDYILAVGERRNIHEVGGVIITSMRESSAAKEAGLRENDVIIAINDVAIKDRAAYHQQINMYRPGDVVKVSVRRNGVERDFNITLVDRDGDKPSPSNSGDGYSNW